MSSWHVSFPVLEQLACVCIYAIKPAVNLWSSIDLCCVQLHSLMKRNNTALTTHRLTHLCAAGSRSPKFTVHRNKITSCPHTHIHKHTHITSHFAIDVLGFGQMSFLQTVVTIKSRRGDQCFVTRRWWEAKVTMWTERQSAEARLRKSSWGWVILRVWVGNRSGLPAFACLQQ